MRTNLLLTASLVAVTVAAIAMTPPSDQAKAALPPAGAAPSADAFAVPVIHSREAPVARPILAAARTAPSRTVELPTEFGGRVTGPSLPVGTRVAPGQEVCALDPGTLPSRLAEAEARMAEAEAADDTAQALVARGHAAEGSLRERHASLQAAAARLAELRREEGQLRIVAPFDGVLAAPTPEPGALLAPMAPCSTVVAMNTLHLTVHLSEGEAAALDTEAEIHARSSDGSTLPASLHSIAPAADPLTGTVELTLAIPNPDGRRRAGETLTVALQTQAFAGHRVPRSALLLSDDGRLGLRVVEGTVSRFLPVAPITEDASGLWVSGLPETVRIVTGGQHFLTDATPIAPVLAEEL